MSSTSGSSRTKKATKVAAKVVAKKSTTTRGAKSALKTSKPKSATTTKAKTTKNKTTKTASKTKQSKPTASNKATTKKASSTVTLPDSFGIRVREKALLLSQTFETDFYPAAKKIAFYGGLCFLAVGSYATLQQAYPSLHSFCTVDGCNQSANVTNGTSSTTQETTTDDQATSGATEPDLDNYAELLSELPDVIDEPTNVFVEVTNVKNIDARAFGFSGALFLPHSKVEELVYKIIIDPVRLEPDDYKLKIQVLHHGTSEIKYYTLGNFSVPTPDADPDSLDQIDDSTTEDVTNGTDVVDETDNEEVDLLQVTKTDSTEETEPVDEQVATTDTNDSDDETDIPSDQDDDELTEENESLVEDDYFVKLVSPKNLSGTQKLQIEAEGDFQSIIVYIRRVTSLNSERLRTIDADRSAFSFDSTSFPNGQYELYAQAKTDTGAFIQSDPEQIRIFNEGVIDTESNSETTDETRETFDPEPEIAGQTTDNKEVELLTITKDPIRNSDTDSSTDDQSEIDDSTENAIEEPILVQAKETLRDNSDELDRLLTAYAAAQQTGDEILINQAESALESYRRNLIDAAIDDERLRFVARELDETLEVQIESLQEKVRTFESIRRDRTDEDSSIDTDGDGISDIDERLLYKTDPNSADSDNDGFLDGVEIVGGFDPLDETPEVPIVYESPKEVIGVLKTEKLVVEAVTPDVQLQPIDEEEVVQTVVRGKGLPNSFVTLYVFSTPTIVTVRTEADGSFEYTFSKELEDGEHQVFVALTDNTGSIVAQSEPFTFVKEAQAFTPVDALATEELVLSNTPSDEDSPYSMVLGMSVLALGILLILLGVGLRANKPDIVIEETSA